MVSLNYLTKSNEKLEKSANKSKSIIPVFVFTAQGEGPSQTVAAVGALFGRGRKTNKNKRLQRIRRTWTVSVMCLSGKDTSRCPSAEEKEILFKAGLGMKRVVFEIDNDTSEVMDKLMTDFVQLKNCGGFELLKCQSNNKALTIIDCEWNVKNLKSCLGPQAKIYIRPIQCNLKTVPIHPDTPSASQFQENVIYVGTCSLLKI